MFSTHRHARCQALLNTLPSFDSPKTGKSMRELLVLLADHYRDCASDTARVRALQNDLKLRVWDYVLRLLEDHQIAPNQTFQREADGDSAIVTARIMQSGTLYRWLLGFGDKVEVLEPASLRHAIAWQASSVTEYYEDIYDAAAEEESEDDGT